MDLHMQITWIAYTNYMDLHYAGEGLLPLMAPGRHLTNYGIKDD